MISFFSSLFLLKSFLLLFNVMFLHQELILKLCLILILFEISFLITYRQELKLNKLSKLRKYAQDSRLWGYQIATKKDLFLSIFYVFSYILIFILGILHLRIQNQNHEINLLIFYLKIKDQILQSSSLNLITSITLIILCIITFITVYKKLFKIFKFHLIKLHLYLNQFPEYWQIFFNTVKYHADKYQSPLYKFKTYTISNFRDLVIHKPLNNFAIFLKLTEKDTFTYSIDSQGKIHPHFSYHERTTWDLLLSEIENFTWRQSFDIHYKILSLILCHDLLFNDLTLKNYFYFLPFFFFYHNWFRISHSFDRLGGDFDNKLSAILYKNPYKDVNEELIYTEDGECICTLDSLEILSTYLKKDLVSPDFENYSPPKGIFLTTLEKPLIFILSSKLAETIQKYNYRQIMIKIHQRVILILVPLIVVLIIMSIARIFVY